MLTFLDKTYRIQTAYSKAKYVQSVKKKKTKHNTSFNFNTNYHKEVKCIPIGMDYWLLQFEALKFFLGASPHGESLPNFNFSNKNPTNLKKKSPLKLPGYKFSQHFHISFRVRWRNYKTNVGF